MKKKILSLLLAAIMVVSLLPTTVMAAGNGNLEFTVSQNDHIGADDKSIEYANGYKLSVTYNDIGENRISLENEHTELRNIPDGTSVTFTLAVPENKTEVPDLLLSGARKTFVNNTVTTNLDFSQSNVIRVELDFGGNPGPGPEPAPEIQNGDIRFVIDKSETDVAEYSTDGTTWTSVATNDVVKAEVLTGAETIYIKAVPGEGRQLDDYIDNNDNISVNRVTVDGTASALSFTNNVASFTYNSAAKTEVTVRFMGGDPGPGQDDGHIVKLQINNNDGANGSVLCKFNTEQDFTTYTTANYDASGNIKLTIPENASTITFKAVPDEGFALQDCTILHDDQDIDKEKAYRSGVEGNGYEYTIPDDDKTIVFRADFGNELVSWHTVSWGGGNVQIENGTVEAYAVHVGENTYDESVETADETNNLYPLSDITKVDIQKNPVSFGDTDMFIADTNTKDVSIDFRFIPDYGYQVTDVIATEGSVLDQFNPGEEISMFHFVYKPNTNVHFIVEFTAVADIINTESSIVSSAAIGDGKNAISSGNLKMNIADVAPENVSEGLKDEVGGNDAQYLDMTLSQVVSKTGSKGNWENPLTELDGSIDVSLTVSDLDPEREYVIIREHKNVDSSTSYDEIPVTYNSENTTITFATDKFSIYALMEKPHTHGEGDDAITFDKAWNDATKLPDTAGNYYLDIDVTLSSTWNVPASGVTNLCLNGHVIEMTGSGSVIKVPQNATLNLYDCDTKTEHYFTVGDNGLWLLTDTQTGTAKTVLGGVITGGNNTAAAAGNGGGVHIEKGTLNMYGGNIVGNCSKNGGGVYVGGVSEHGTIYTGTFNLSGGTIAGNTVTQCGGGVSIESEGKGEFTMTGGEIIENTASLLYGGGVFAQSAITLGGTAKITGNTAGAEGSKTANNLYLYNDTTVTLGMGSNGAAVPASGMSVGVTTKTAPVVDSPVSFTNTSVKSNTKYFFSDSDNYYVTYSGASDAIQLAAVTGTGNVLNVTKGKRYDGFGDAFATGTVLDEADPGDTLKLLANVETSSTIEVSETLTLDLNGHVIDAKGGAFSVITVENTGNLTLIDSSPTTEHDGYVDADGLWHLGEIPQGAENCTAKPITGGVITGGNASFGGGVFVDKGTLTMSGGNIAGCRSTGETSGGGVYINGGAFTMNGGSITGCQSTDCGGGVYVTGETATMTMEGGEITNNTALCGGGIQSNAGMLNLTAAADKTITITGNTAIDAEGGVANWGVMHLSGKVIIKGNICTEEYNGVNYPVDLATDSPIIIDGALTGSEIRITHASKSTDEHDSGVLTSGFTTNNPGAKLGDFFTYDGPDSYAMILNSNNELEVVNTYAITNGAKQDDEGANHGYLTINKVSTFEGDTVTITVTPSSDYQLTAGSLKVLPSKCKKCGEALTSAECDRCGEPFVSLELNQNQNGIYTFAMPNYAVTATAEFKKNPAPSGGGDYTPTVTVPVSGEENSVNVKATVSGKTATVQPIKEEEIEKVIGDDVDTGMVTVDLSGLKQDVTGVKLPTETVEAIAEAAAETGNDTAGLALKLASGTLEFDAKALETIVKAAGNAKNIEIHFDNVGITRLNADQKAAVSEMIVVGGFEAYVTANGQRVSDFNGGSVTIYIPYEIPEGNNQAGYTVWFVAEDGTLEKQNATYDGTNHRFVVSHFSDYVLTYDETYGAYDNCPKDATCPASKFTDVNVTAWYHDGVHFCVENGIMKGVSDTKFDTTGDITRAQIVTMLWRLDGEKYANYAMTFQDVPAEQWYTEAIRWAAAEKIVSGYDAEHFGPEDPITREQLATILYNYAKYKGQGFTGDWMFLLDFVDRADISSWADEAVHWCSMKGVVTGKDGKVFDPQGTATRAEAASMIQRFCEALEK